MTKRKTFFHLCPHLTKKRESANKNSNNSSKKKKQYLPRMEPSQHTWEGRGNARRLTDASSRQKQPDANNITTGRRCFSLIWSLSGENGSLVVVMMLMVIMVSKVKWTYGLETRRRGSLAMTGVLLSWGCPAVFIILSWTLPSSGYREWIC